MAGIRDIAERAGVSIGTVDRVLHNRGRCADETRSKVLAAAQELNYRPNLVARNLKRNEPCRLVVLQALPRQDQRFWAWADEGVALAVRDFEAVGVEIEIVPFDRYSSASFSEACERVLGDGCQGVLLAPLLPLEARAFVDDHPELAIVVFDCPLAHPRLLQSIYQEGIAGGETVAGLMRMSLPEESRTAVIGYDTPNPNIAARMDGFVKAMVAAGYPEPDRFLIPDELEYDELVHHLARQEIDLASYDGLFIAKTGAYKYSRLLAGCGTVIIGYDPVPDNLEELRSGGIQALISQNSTTQAYEGLKTLVNRLLYDRTPVQQHISMPIDILTRENLDAYLSYHRKGDDTSALKRFELA